MLALLKKPPLWPPAPPPPPPPEKRLYRPSEAAEVHGRQDDVQRHIAIIQKLSAVTREARTGVAVVDRVDSSSGLIHSVCCWRLFLAGAAGLSSPLIWCDDICMLLCNRQHRDEHMVRMAGCHSRVLSWWRIISLTIEKSVGKYDFAAAGQRLLSSMQTIIAFSMSAFLLGAEHS